MRGLSFATERGSPRRGSEKEAEMIKSIHKNTEYISCGAVAVPVAMSLHAQTSVDNLIAAVKSIIKRH